jgi:hypothetical protein
LEVAVQPSTFDCQSSAVLSQAVEDDHLAANPAINLRNYLRRGDEPEPEQFVSDRGLPARPKRGKHEMNYGENPACSQSIARSDRETLVLSVQC